MVSMTKARFRDLLERTAGFGSQVFVFKKTGAPFPAFLTPIKPGREKPLSFRSRC